MPDPSDNPELYREMLINGIRYWSRIKEPVAANLPRTTRWGWRVVYTRPAEERLTLYSAVYGAPNRGLRRPDCCTTSRVMRAVCSQYSHNPPADGCSCGIYAVENVVDALYRLRAMAANICGLDSYHSWFPYHPDRGMVPVLARVRLRGAMDYDDEGTWAVLAEAKRVIRTATPVLRAASAEITRLFVPHELLDGDGAVELTGRLAETFGVEAAMGLPLYTRADVEAAPSWMREEPWCTSYAVERVMAPLRPVSAAAVLHVAFVCQGNICRSPMVEKMFARQLLDRGMAGVVRCSSAGWDAARHAGAPADERTRAVLTQQGYPSAHRAAQVTDENLSADLVVALDRTDARKLAAAGVPDERLRLLRSFDPAAASADVANPYYGTCVAFEATLSLIVSALPGLHEWVDAQLALTGGACENAAV